MPKRKRPGGKRPGAGRPRQYGDAAAVTFSARLDPAAVAKVRARAEEREISQGRAASELILRE